MRRLLRAIRDRWAMRHTDVIDLDAYRTKAALMRVQEGSNR